MKYEQAYKECKTFFENDGIGELDGVAFNMALNALEKQIPKKPLIHGYRECREINTISYTCPVCNKHISRENFCNHCGQALFWESEER